MGPDDAIRVEVVFATAERQALVRVDLCADAVVDDAIEASGIAGDFPDHELSTYQVGIWGRPVGRDHGLQDGDRVEIYRPLVIDPREARRRLAAEGKSMGGHHDGEARKRPRQ